MNLRLGPVTLANHWIIAPMEGVTDAGFRKLCASLGASLTFTEMIRGSAFVRENKATLALIDTYNSDVPTGIQLITKGPDELRKILEKFFELRNKKEFSHFHNIKVIELNFGCPSEEIIKQGLGPAMLKRTKRMEETFRTLKEIVKQNDTSITIGAKLRLGLNQAEKERKVIAKLVPAINEHLDYVAIHAKHAAQRASEPADWNALKELRKEIKIPLIGNGSVFTADDARRMIEETGVDGVMIARGATRNPWVFRQLAKKGDELPMEEEVEQAWKQYKKDAAHFKTKQKYCEFHEENFNRIMEEARSREKEQRLPAKKEKVLV